jgi:hypothetical protein
MAHAAQAQITCRVCDGWYASESDLRNHMQAAHRRFAHEPSESQSAVAQPDNVKAEPRNVKSEPRTPNEEWNDEEWSAVSGQAGRAGR